MVRWSFTLTECGVFQQQVRFQSMTFNMSLALNDKSMRSRDMLFILSVRKWKPMRTLKKRKSEIKPHIESVLQSWRQGL